jgi:hypothetical protein
MRLIIDFRLSIADLRSAPPLWRLPNTLIKVRNGALSPRDVKNEDRPGYMHENTGDDDRMASEKHGFYTKMHQMRDNRQHSVGLIGRKCTQVTRKIGAKADPKSAHRPIDPWEEHGVGF